MKLADDVDFIPGMELWNSEGEKLRLYELLDHCGNPWIEEVGNTHGGLLCLYYSSKENWEKDYNSPKNHCFVCGYFVKPHLPPSKDKNYGMMWGDGLFFRATGNFGSTIFDPMDDQFLEIIICDACVVDRQASLRHWANEFSHDPQGPPYAYTKRQ